MKEKQDLSSQPFLIPDIRTTSVTMEIIAIDRDGIYVGFSTLDGNDPKKNANHIYVWQATSNQVPWHRDPDVDVAVITNLNVWEQDVEFDVQSVGYILGYGVAPTPQAVCTTVYIPKNKHDDPSAWEFSHLSIKLNEPIKVETVEVNYYGLPAYNPHSNKNWVAIWEGESAPYPYSNNATFIGTETKLENSNPGKVKIKNLQLKTKTSYSVGYFLVNKDNEANDRTTLAAMLSFKSK